MTERITKSMAKNIYYGGGLFALLIFLGLSFDTVQQIPERSNEVNMTESVVAGKALWEKNNCVGCHTLIGEGAYYAPELMNVFNRRGASDETTFKGYMQGWMAAQPLSEPNRRKMPQFHLSTEEVDNLSDFLIWTSKVNANKWPPTIEG
ncbi:c-type cytochrome [Poseidonibacter sp.]|uniref:c-type cytochrome n=1 Tax=Poseidonibacter sp. TaxID=2321188 RepID=UPI003C76C267